MIGKSLRERYTLEPLAPSVATNLAAEALETEAARVVEVRAADRRMIACLVFRADEATVRVCRSLGFRVRPGGTGVFGLLGRDAARVIPDLTDAERAWLEAPSGPRETKLVLLSSGRGLVSIETAGGQVTLSPAPGAHPESSAARGSTFPLRTPSRVK